MAVMVLPLLAAVSEYKANMMHLNMKQRMAKTMSGEFWRCFLIFDKSRGVRHMEVE